MHKHKTANEQIANKQLAGNASRPNMEMASAATHAAAVIH